MNIIKTRIITACAAGTKVILQMFSCYKRERIGCKFLNNETFIKIVQLSSLNSSREIHIFPHSEVN